MSADELNHCRSIRTYFESMDLDRTFFVCFRGQKLGRTPTLDDIDKITIGEYLELVKYIRDTSFTELMIMHALHPFDKQFDDELEFLNPVKHSLFYFRNDDYVSNLTCSQRNVYTCSGDYGDAFVDDLRLAMAKDLVFNDKMEFDSKNDNASHINIRKYDGIWFSDLKLKDVINKYTQQYSELKNVSVDDMKISGILGISNVTGSFRDFKCDGKNLNDVMIEDFLNELKVEFPDCF